MTQEIHPKRLWMFFALSFGQLVSLIGSSLSGFALGVWVYQSTGSVTQYVFIAFFTTLPGILLAPLAGVLVDRWDRRWTMILSDTGAGLCTLFLATMFLAHRLEVWHIYLAMAIVSTVTSVQWPAFSSSTILMIPKEQLGRINGVIQGGFAVAQIVAPALAGALVVNIGVQGVILIDFATFLISITTLMLVRIPRPTLTEDAKANQGSLFKEAAYGLRYLTSRPGLMALLVFFSISTFLVCTVGILATPLVLSFASPAEVGLLLTVGGIGMLIGSLLMGIWGGPKRRMYGILGFMFISSFFIMLAGLQPSILLLGFASFFFFLCQPIVDGCSQTLFQNKVEPGVQGRVFAISGVIAGITAPLADVVAGPLADNVFEPWMAVHGPLAGSVGKLIGVGPGRGIALIFITFGFLSLLTAVVGYLIPRIRKIDIELPDMFQDESPKDEPAPLNQSAYQPQPE